MAEGIGAINFWGFSPALDLLDDVVALEQGSESQAERQPLNVLLFGCGDGRHLFRTLAQLKRQGSAWSE